MLEDLVTVTKSACQNIIWQKWEECAGRFSDCHQICQAGNLLAEWGEYDADIMTVTKSACQNIIWQK